MALIAATVVDSRGRRVSLVHATTVLTRGDRERLARIAAVSGGPRQPITKREFVRGVVCGVMVIPLFVALALVPSMLAFRTSLPWWAQLLASMPLGAMPALLTLFVVRRAAGDRIARDWIRAGYCASCGQDLTGVAPADDDCVVCPECGAAWRRSSAPAGVEETLSEAPRRRA